MTKYPNTSVAAENQASNAEQTFSNDSRASVRHVLACAFVTPWVLGFFVIGHSIAVQPNKGEQVLAGFEGEKPVAANYTTHKAKVTAVGDAPELRGLGGAHDRDGSGPHASVAPAGTAAARSRR